MKLIYDSEVDALYIQFSQKRPEGGVEMNENVVVHTTSSHEIVSIEILEASKRIPLKNLSIPKTIKKL